MLLKINQEVERGQHVLVVGELHQVFVDDLGARFGSYVRTQVDRQVAVGIDVGALPRHAVAVGETRTAARQYAELRIDRKGRMDEVVLRNAFAEDVVSLGSFRASSILNSASPSKAPNPRPRLFRLPP